jgi:peptidoglycan/xylan/chitin deacetylase (PgdA/CDA1 family)
MTANAIFTIPWRILPKWLVGDRLKILMYHSVSDNPRDPHAIAPDEFTQQMKILRSKRVVSLREGLDYLRDGCPLRNVYVITFDDALLDFYTTALPVLREFGYPVTMFVSTGMVAGKAVWDTFDKTKPTMSWKQLEECQGEQVVYGSHTVNHIRLQECSDAKLADELETSLIYLQKRLDVVIPALAYPGGYHNARVRLAARSVGYSCALGASSRWGNGPESDLFQLRRQSFIV